MFAKFSRGILQVAGLLAILALLVAIGTFMFLAPLLQYQDRPERADYILPLAGNEDRLVKAAELYKQGLAPKILLSNEQIRPLSRAQKIAAKIGYPPTDPSKIGCGSYNILRCLTGTQNYLVTALSQLWKRRKHSSNFWATQEAPLSS